MRNANVEAKKQDKHQKEQDKRNDLGNNHGVKDRSIVAAMMMIIFLYFFIDFPV